MINHHTLCHAALAATYMVTGIILSLEGALAHGVCAFAAAVIYAALTREQSHRGADETPHDHDTDRNEVRETHKNSAAAITVSE